VVRVREGEGREKQEKGTGFHRAHSSGAAGFGNFRLRSCRKKRSFWPKRIGLLVRNKMCQAALPSHPVFFRNMIEAQPIVQKPIKASGRIR
jgi:hypothetical protein